MKRQFEWTRGLDESKVSEWNQTFQRLLADFRGLREGNPNDEPSRTLIDDWIGGFARLHSRTPDTKFTRWMLKRLESSYDAHIARCWELICKIKRIPHDPTYAHAFGRLLNVLRERVCAPRRRKRALPKEKAGAG